LRLIHLHARLLDEAGCGDEKNEQEHDHIDERNQIQLDRLVRLTHFATESHAKAGSLVSVDEPWLVVGFALGGSRRTNCRVIPEKCWRKWRSVMPSSRARNATYSLRQRLATCARSKPGIATIMPVCVATSASL